MGHPRRIVVWISWRHQDSDFSGPLSFEQKVDLFCEQALGWQLHIADPVANGGTPFGEAAAVSPIRHSGFAVLQICLSYFETIGQYTATPSGSRAAFRVGVLSVFPGLAEWEEGAVSEFIDAFYGTLDVVSTTTSERPALVWDSRRGRSHLISRTAESSSAPSVYLASSRHT